MYLIQTTKDWKKPLLDFLYPSRVLSVWSKWPFLYKFQENLSRQCNSAQLATTGCHSSGEESVPSVVRSHHSQFITVSVLYCLSLLLFLSCLYVACFTCMSCFLFLFPLPLTSSSLCVGWEGESHGAWGWWQVVGRSWLTLCRLLLCLSQFFFMCACVDVISAFLLPHCEQDTRTAISNPQHLFVQSGDICFLKPV